MENVHTERNRWISSVLVALFTLFSKRMCMLILRVIELVFKSSRSSEMEVQFLARLLTYEPEQWLNSPKELRNTE